MSLGSNDNIQYGAHDFERYYSGQMTAQEMHALEKAALEDPFLADALEGYKATPSPAADAAWLKEQLATKTGKGKVAPFAAKKSYPFLRIAALVLLLAGAGWSVYYLMNGRKDTLALEQNGKTENRVQKAPAPVAVPDTLQQQTLSLKEESAPSALPPAPPLPRQRAKPPAAKREEIPATTMAAAPVNEDRNADSATPMLLRQKEAEDVAAVEKKQIVPQALEGRAAGVTIQNTNRLNNFQGRVVDANNQGVPFASVTVRNKKTSVSTDEQGYFSLNTPDSVVTANVAAVGFNTQNVTLHPQQPQNTIVLKQSPEALSEVVVVGYGKAKKNTASRSARTSRPQPAEGWEEFEDYVEENRKSSGELSPQDLKGSVTLSFDVNRKGLPTNIKVDSSLAPAYDAEAVRLLREGPRWERRKDRRGKVTIPFQ